MKIKKSDLLCIAAKPAQYPSADAVEIAFAGRSNVGKSSLINLLLGRKNLARVSGSPGKTRTINFYTINDDAFRVVDLPGYGYAKVSKTLSADWGDMIETYLKQRDNLAIVVQLVD
ncbi:MAG: ribosome biogenesis GTP-binding protein YsxC, partial [Firmicutes bacterium]|nr:ribosome biogenesis GTP-binding protein YsxC [Bacillota bacterium]